LLVFANIHYLNVQNKTFKIWFVKINKLHLGRIGSKKEFLKIFFIMEIQKIKQRLTMAQVLTKYGLKPDKHKRMNFRTREYSAG